MDVACKRRILSWLGDIKLIREGVVSVADFPQYCRNGVIFFDLVNRLQGRNPVLKGANRNPKNVTGILSNYKKVLEYLRAFPKMNPRFLWDQEEMMEGSADTIWGFLDDVWHWHHNKTSPFDPSRRPQAEQQKPARAKNLPLNREYAAGTELLAKSQSPSPEPPHRIA